MWLLGPPPIARMKKRKDLGELEYAVDYKKGSNDPKHIAVRIAAIEAIGEIGGPVAVAILSERLRSPWYGNMELNKSMVKALGNIDDPGAVEPILRAIGYPSYGTLPEEALVQKGPKAFKPLLEAIRSGDRYAGDILRKIGGYQATQEEMDGLIRDLGSKHRNRYEGAARVLGQLRDPRGFEPLIHSLAVHIDDRVIPEELGEWGDLRAVEPLMNCVGNLNRGEAASAALAKLGDERAIPALTKVIESGHVSGTSWGLSEIDAAKEAIKIIRQRAKSNQ